VAPAVAVLSAPGDAMVAAGGVALGLARRGSAPAVLVCVWTGGEEARPCVRCAASGVARRLAAALAARGHDAFASGRLAVVRLAASGDDAVAEARRAFAAAGTAPTVLAVAAARGPAFDGLLAAQDLVLVARGAGAGEALARIALSDLETLGCRAAVYDLVSGPVGRTLAAAGAAFGPAPLGPPALAALSFASA
jgi:hypothetical protein